MDIALQEVSHSLAGRAGKECMVKILREDIAHLAQAWLISDSIAKLNPSLSKTGLTNLIITLPAGRPTDPEKYLLV